MNQCWLPTPTGCWETIGTASISPKINAARKGLTSQLLYQEANELMVRSLFFQLDFCSSLLAQSSLITSCMLFDCMVLINRENIRREWRWKFETDIYFPRTQTSMDFLASSHMVKKITTLHRKCIVNHYNDVIMTTVTSQITILADVYSIVYSGADERKHQSSASLAFMRGTHWDLWIHRTKGQ